MMFVSGLRQVGDFLRVLGCPPPIKLTATENNWNIVESRVKHHTHNPNERYNKHPIVIRLLVPIYAFSILALHGLKY